MDQGMDAYLLVDDPKALIGEVPEDSIVSRTLESAPGLKTVLFGFAPGQELSEHTSSKRALLNFVRGRAVVTLGADRHEVEAGAWVDMPPHLAHSIRAGEETVVMLLVMIG